MKLQTGGVSWRRTGEEVVVLDLARGEYFSLNASGVLLWERLAAEPQTGQQLAALLQETYGLSAVQAQGDVAAFTATLMDRGLAWE
jgi:hypothetical protein